MADNAQPPANVDMDMNDELDAAIEADMKPEVTQSDAMNLDGANDADASQRNGVSEIPLEARIPAKKDATLREFLSKMDDYAPIVWLPPLLGKTLANPTSVDTRRGYKLLPHARRTPTATANVATPCSTACACYAEVHRGHRRRRIPVLAHPRVQYHE